MFHAVDDVLVGVAETYCLEVCVDDVHLLSLDIEDEGSYRVAPGIDGYVLLAYYGELAEYGHCLADIPAHGVRDDGVAVCVDAVDDVPEGVLSGKIGVFLQAYYVCPGVYEV